MSRRKDKQPCAMPGCKCGGFFHGFCKNDFKVHYGISWEEYKAAKGYKGESPVIVAARIKGLDPAKFVPGKVESTDDIMVDGRPLSEFPGVFASVERVAPALAATAVIFPQDLWDKISEIADREFRTPDQQILYMVHSILEPSAKSTWITLEMPRHEFKQRMLTLLETDPVIRAALGK